jgi:hypothetical protein
MGIRAGSMKAKNVVDGIQLQGGDAETVAQLVKLAQGIRSGAIEVTGLLEADSVVSGLQFIKNPATATPDDLRHEVAALRGKLERALAEGSIADDDAGIQDAAAALTAAESELSAPQPQGSRVVRKLSEVSDVLTESAEAAENAGKVGEQLAKLAPIAAVLWQVARGVFGM